MMPKCDENDNSSSSSSRDCAQSTGANLSSDFMRVGSKESTSSLSSCEQQSMRTSCLADADPSTRVEQPLEYSCKPNKRGKAFVEALTRASAKDDTYYDVKSLHKQRAKNEQLKDQVRRQKGLSAGVVLEGQNISQRITFQESIIQDIQRQSELHRNYVQEMQVELAQLTSVTSLNQTKRDQELAELEKELDDLFKSEQNYQQQQQLNNQLIKSELHSRFFIQSDADLLFAQLNETKYKNVKKQLSMQFLNEQKAALEAELLSLENRDAVHQTQMDKLNSCIRAHDIEVNRRQQEVKQQEVEVHQLEQSICDVEDSARREKCECESLCSLLQEKTCQKDSLQQEVQEQDISTEKTKARNVCMKGEMAEVKQLLQQELTLQQDVFQMQLC